LYEYCQKQSELLSKNGLHLDDALTTLGLQEHSLGIMFVLQAKISSTPPQEMDELVARVREFVSDCNGEQIRHAPEVFADVCHFYAQTLLSSGRAVKGIAVLSKAIDKVQMHPAHLTSIHSDLCQLCLVAQCLKPAVSLLDRDITDISRENGHFDVKYFLLYYYYGGMIYAAVKNYDRALYFFEMALTTHSLAVSCIMLEAYKKYVLISLTVHGKVLQLPKYTPQVVSRFIRPMSQQYLDLAVAYSTNNPEELKQVIAKHSEAFTRDNNVGLVNQVLQSLHKKNIQRLTKTFLTLSLTDVATRVSLANADEAESRIITMVSLSFETHSLFPHTIIVSDRKGTDPCICESEGGNGRFRGQS
jgi:COP9 signalosome complex subunit 3